MAEKKKFFSVELPLIGEKAEVLAFSEEDLAGRTLKIDLTRKLRGKSTEIIFKLKQENKKIRAFPIRLYVLGYFIRRMMRKSIDYVEDSFIAECKDSLLIIKPFLITRKKVSRAVRKALRNKAKEEINNAIKEKISEEIFSELLSGRFQKSLSLKLKKIYPLALCEIRDFLIEKEKPGIKVEKIQ